MSWRFIDTGLASPPYTAAVDETIVKALAKGLVKNTLHFYRRNKPTISLGYFQKISESINLNLCKKYDVQIIRRVSGGSAIYTDSGQLIYALAVKDILPENIIEAYRKVCSAIIYALDEFGLDAKFKPINDVQINGRKISGSAQVKKWGVVLQHGTILVDTNLNRMFELLKIPKAKLKAAHLKRPANMVTTLKNELGYKPQMKDVKRAVLNGFNKVFKIKFEKGQLTEFEMKLIRKLIKVKYGNDRWNFKR